MGFETITPKILGMYYSDSGNVYNNSRTNLFVANEMNGYVPILDLIEIKKNEDLRFVDGKNVENEIVTKFEEEHPDDIGEIKEIIGAAQKETVRRIIAGEKLRVDGRNVDEVRPIKCEVGVLARTHGSSLFTRGETQALASTSVEASSSASPRRRRRTMLDAKAAPMSTTPTRPVMTSLTCVPIE